MTRLNAGSATDIGKVRTTNQDQLLVAARLFAVADGMGGHAAGEVASLTAVEALRASFDKDSTADGLLAAAEAANRSIWDRAHDDPELRGMGTTLVAVALVDQDGEDRLAIINVGDSRGYLLRQGELEQLTTDHSLVQELVDDGQISELEATTHPQRHVLTRALGVDSDVRVDCLQLLPMKGDRLLLCSDGLSREVNDGQVASVLRRFAGAQEAAQELISAARARGGNDNITVVVIDVVDDDDRAIAASDALATQTGIIIPSEHRAPVTKGSSLPLPPDSGPAWAPSDDAVSSRPSGRDSRLTMAGPKPGASRTSGSTPGSGRTSGPGRSSEAGPKPDAAAKPGRRATRRAGATSGGAPKPRALTFRVVGFLALMVLLVGTAAVTVAFYARGTYFVALDHAEVTIYKGRPGGLLWFHPTVVRRTGVQAGDIQPVLVSDLRDGVEEASLRDAERYVASLKPGAPPATTTSATTTAAPTPGSSTSAP